MRTPQLAPPKRKKGFLRYVVKRNGVVRQVQSLMTAVPGTAGNRILIEDVEGCPHRSCGYAYVVIASVRQVADASYI